MPLRLTFAGRRSARRYLTVPVDVGDLGFVDFLLEVGHRGEGGRGGWGQGYGPGGSGGGRVGVGDLGGVDFLQGVAARMGVGAWG